MELKFSKIFGWILLFLGLGLIFYSILSSYQIFIGKREPPQVFVAKQELQKEVRIPVPGTGKEVEVSLPEQLQKILSSGFFSPRLLNLVAWSMWAWILIFAGGKISSLGIKLVK